MKKINNFFTSEDLQNIEKAVIEAEKKTSGEIVPYFVESSSNYLEVYWKTGSVGAVFSGVFLILINHYFWVFNFIHEPLLFFLTILTSSLSVCGLAIFFPGFRRMMIGHEIIEKEVRNRAERAFLKEEVFKTKDRTGILIFLSIFEKKVIVLGDSGIHSKLKDKDWEETISIITKELKSKNRGTAFVKGIEKCGELLQKSGFTRKANDVDELPNKLRKGKQK